MRRALMISLIAGFAVAGCASYDGGPVPSEGAQGYPGAPVTRSVNGVVVEADPYLRFERQADIFDAAFVEHQILAVYMTVGNGGAKPVLIRRSDMALVTADGIKLIPVDSDLVSARVDPGPSLLSFLFAIVGGGLHGTAERSALNVRTADYLAKQFKDITLGANESASGFVYFMAVESDPQFRGATMRVRVADMTGEQSFDVALPFAIRSP